MSTMMLEELRATFESSAWRDELVAEGYARSTKAARADAAARAVAWRAAAAVVKRMSDNSAI